MKLHNIVFKIIIPITLLAIPWLIPNYNFNYDTDTLLTITALLFTILTGFFIAAATSNYLRFQTLIAEEDAALIALYGIAKKINPGQAKEIAKRIDEYMIATLDYESLDYISNTEKEIDAVIEATDDVAPQDASGHDLFSYLHEKKTDIYRIRQEAHMTGKKIVTSHHWIILILLATLIVIFTLTLRNGSLFVLITMGILFLVIYYVLHLIYKIDSNEFLAGQLAYEDPQKVFSGIGALPYYPETALKKKHVKPPNSDYRVGVYTDPGSMKKDIQIVKYKRARK